MYCEAKNNAFTCTSVLYHTMVHKLKEMESTVGAMGLPTSVANHDSTIPLRWR